jgi:hypothetical protein
LLLGIGLMLAGCAAPPADPPLSPEEAGLLADFQRSAYGAVRPVLGNDGAARSRRDHLAKWLIPIRIGLIAEPGDDLAAYSAMVERHRRDLVAATGLDIVVTGPEEANLLIFFGADPFETARREKARYGHLIRDPRAFNALLAQMEQSATCFGLLWGGWPSGRTIEFSVVFVRTNLGPRTVEGCLVQETTQILGLLHDLDPEADSVFSDSGRQVHLTDRDRLLLQLLYDPRLQPGMGWAEAEPLARTALRELLDRGALQTGQQ